MHTQNLQHIFAISAENLHTHEAIVKALMCLCLDNVTHTLGPSSRSSSLPQPSNISQANLDSHLHAIRSVASNVSNRFFDKPISLIVDPSGRAGAIGEHSPCDALVPSIVGEYAVVQQVETQSSLPDEHTSEGWGRLDWITDDRVMIAARDARERAESIIENSDDSMLWFEDYGADWMKGAGSLISIAISSALYSNALLFFSRIQCRCVHPNGIAARVVSHNGTVHGDL